MAGDSGKLPRSGDTLTNGWTVDYVADGVVWIKGRANPIPLDNIAPTDAPGVWKLVKVASTEE